MASNIQGGPVDVAGAAYRTARTRSRNMSDMRLRWDLKQLLRHRGEGRLDAAGLVRLRAVTDEHRARGMELPS